MEPGTWLFLALTLLLGTGIGVLAIWLRQKWVDQSTSAPGAPGGNARLARREDVDALNESHQRDLVHVETVLVPLHDLEFPDVFLAVGPSHQLESLITNGEMQPAGRTIAAGNLVAQTLQGYSEASNLVRLSPQTARLMKSGAEVVKAPGGFNYGILRDPASGRFAGQVQWAKAGGAVTALSTAAALSNALAMAAIQMQLNAISDQISSLSEVVDRLGASLRFSFDADLRARVRAVGDVREQAEQSGMVTDRQLGVIQGTSKDLDAHLRRLESECEASLRRHAQVNSQEDRLKWLREDGLVVAKHLSEMAIASRAWITCRSLEAANLLSPDDSPDPVVLANREAAEVSVAQTRERMRAFERLLGHLAYEFGRALDVVALTTGKVTFQEQTISKVVPISLDKDALMALAQVLREQLNSLGINLPPVPLLPEVPEIGRLTGDDENWRKVVALLLTPNESVQLILHGQGFGGHHNFSLTPSALVVTDKRVLGFRKQELCREAKVRLSEPLSSIQGVEQKSAYREPQLRITLKQGKIPLLAGIDVDLHMELDEIQEAILALGEVREGRTRFSPQGPDFDQAIRRLDGGLRWREEEAGTPGLTTIGADPPIQLPVLGDVSHKPISQADPMRARGS